MLTPSRLHALDLVVLGGLTIDRFPDGSSAPGGGVIHIVRATAARGLQLGVVTAAGPEPVALAGLAELRRLSTVDQVASYPVTTTFRHREALEGRRLWLEQSGGMVAVPSDSDERFFARAFLFAPVAGEIDADALLAWGPVAPRGAILQGWLRAPAEGREVEALSVSTLPAALRDALAGLDLIVTSREDLRAEGDDPAMQLLAVRGAVGNGPIVTITDGIDGLWLSSNSSATHLAAPWTVEGVSTVGAGDVLAAFMLASLAAGEPATAAAGQAMRIVAEVLEERKRG
jgi:sugar/nucleoside kinase (ribokinase family)